MLVNSKGKRAKDHLVTAFSPNVTERHTSKLCCLENCIGNHWRKKWKDKPNLYAYDIIRDWIKTKCIIFQLGKFLNSIRLNIYIKMRTPISAWAKNNAEESWRIVQCSESYSMIIHQKQSLRLPFSILGWKMTSECVTLRISDEKSKLRGKLLDTSLYGNAYECI